MRSSLEPDSRRTPIASHSLAETVPARSCRSSRSGKLPRPSSIGWSRPLAGERERYLRQQIELGGAEVVLSRAVKRSVGQPVVPVDDRLIGDENSSPSSQPPERLPARPPDRPSSRPSWRKGCP